ncbi:MAG: heavy-metal-associated domain-containing protein [Pseudomonadota bacterium]|jgi:copper chaperone|nr:heavy-metal-associated domain-containing protein [Pseudomonadota bacterium]
MYHFVVPAMKCGGCLGAITRSLQKLDPQAQVEGNLEERTIKVASDKAENLLLTALSNAGYPAQTVLQQEA